MKILNHREIRQKTKRLAIEIIEHNYEAKEIILAGINNNGMAFAQMLYQELGRVTKIKLNLTTIKLNPADPLGHEIEFGLPLKQIKGKVVIIVDDVANTGRTIFYACKPLMQTLPKKIEVAVLVDRQHKSFPVKVDYVGLSLATTLKENIDVQIKNQEELAVFLD